MTQLQETFIHVIIFISQDRKITQSYPCSDFNVPISKTQNTDI